MGTTNFARIAAATFGLVATLFPYQFLIKAEDAITRRLSSAGNAALVMLPLFNSDSACLLASPYLYLLASPSCPEEGEFLV